MVEREGSLLQIRLDPNTTPLNLDYTLNCGQVFRWEKRGEYWYGVVEGVVIKLWQNDYGLSFKTFPEEREAEFIQRYLRLDDNLPKIVSEIDKDITIQRALKALYGLRITRQDPWECLISYICATFSNISRIKGMIQNLSRKFGAVISCDDLTFYTFPTWESLMKANLGDITDCGLGYRARYVQETSRMIKDLGINPEGLKRLTYKEAKKQLLILPGIGPKVADCILLFSMDKLEAFPVDVWVRKIFSKYYSQHFSDSKPLTGEGFTTGRYEKISAFGRAYFGEYAGYAQEYLFHYYRLYNPPNREKRRQGRK